MPSVAAVTTSVHDPAKRIPAAAAAASPSVASAVENATEHVVWLPPSDTNTIGRRVRIPAIPPAEDDGFTMAWLPSSRADSFGQWVRIPAVPKATDGRRTFRFLPQSEGSKFGRWKKMWIKRPDEVSTGATVPSNDGSTVMAWMAPSRTKEARGRWLVIRAIDLPGIVEAIKMPAGEAPPGATDSGSRFEFIPESADSSLGLWVSRHETDAST